MLRTLVAGAISKIGERILLHGWVDIRRDLGKIVFVHVRDRTGEVQVVIDSSVTVPPDLNAESVVQIEGVVKERAQNQVNSKLKTGTIEIAASKVTVLAPAAPSPFDRDAELGLDVYLDHLPLTLRRARARAIFKVQAAIVDAFRLFLKSKGFVEFQAPKLVAQATEGGANVFRVDYFDQNAFLAQSPQFYKQIMVGVFERVFTVGNVYRAEEHATTRHLNEYTSLDFEMGFINDHTDIMAVQVEFLRALVAHLESTVADEFALLGATLPRVPETIPTVTLRESQHLLEKEYKIECADEPDLAPEHEKLLCEWSQKTHESEFVFVTHFPTSKRPFYTMPDPHDPAYARSFDLLFRGVEVTTGSQRINRYDDLIAAIEGRALKPEDFSFYLEAFKYGMPPEGGLAMGLERLTSKFLGVDNVKEATLFPRDLNRIDLRLRQ